nr:RNA-directed DNA polymerase, eukaryota [Tanacetum cinerariifolium]
MRGCILYFYYLLKLSTLRPNGQIHDGDSSSFWSPDFCYRKPKWLKTFVLLARFVHKNTKASIFKIYFEKAFDSVRWDYLNVVLNNFGFGPKWRSWIQGYLYSAMGSILVNGSLTSEFKFSKGLKHGDPLSPFLFILIMESLHVSFNNVVNDGLYNGIHIDDSLSLSHLFYVDDVIFVGKWNLSTIVNVLEWFHLALGLKINLYKSKIMGIGIPHDVVALAARSTGCSTLHTPFKYLKVKLGGIMSRLSSEDDVVAKLSSRLSKWKLKPLSIGGYLTLIKSVLSSSPLYYMSSFKVPKGLLNKMETTLRNFFNGVENAEKKMSLIYWNKILASKKNGALGVSSFFSFNRTLLFKWIWRFSAKGFSLWSRFITAIYNVRGALDNPLFIQDNIIGSISLVKSKSSPIRVLIFFRLSKESREW